MKALTFPWFVVKVRPLCTRGSLEATDAGKPDRAFMVRQGWVFEVSEVFFLLVCRASSGSVRTPMRATMYPARFSVTVLRRLFRRLMASRSSGVDHGLVCLPILDLPTCVLAAKIKVLLSRSARSRREMGLGG